MTVDDLAKQIEGAAKSLKLPLSTINVFDDRRPWVFGKKRPSNEKQPDPYVTCEIQDDASMKVGKMTVKLSEVKELLSFRNGGSPAKSIDAAKLICDRLIAAAQEAGVTSVAS